MDIKQSIVGPQAGTPGGLYFSKRYNKPITDQKGHTVKCKPNSRLYRRSFSGTFGGEKQEIKEMMS